MGSSAARIDAPVKLTGEADYPGDRIPGDALWAMAVFTDQPHARLVSLDLSAAETVPGVVAVLGSADVPVNEFGLTMSDHPVFVGLQHSGRSNVACDVSRWEADRLALVVAETPGAARAGAAAIDARWEPLPVLADIDESLASDTLIHPESGQPTNAYYSLRIRKGDMAQGWGRRGRGGGVHLRAALPGARLPAARGRTGLSGRRGPGDGGGRRPVDA